jgi:thiamine transport system ATP-binding protein
MLELGGITVRFGRIAALDDVILTVPDRSVVALIGPSGSGKSTLLRVIAGLEHPDAGEIRWDGETILEVPPHRLDFGMMFQDYALFPHRSVAQNVAFGLRMNRFAGDDLAERTKASLELVGLAGYGSRSVGTLSGGEQQRVALARTLAPEPRLVLLDEPLGALDRALRERLVEDMREIFDSVEATALYVTHDREEAFTIADRVAIIDEGKIQAEGTRRELVAMIGEKDRVTISAGGDLTAAAESVREVAGVSEASSSDHQLHILTDDASSILPELLVRVTDSGGAIAGVEVLEPNLEAVFLHLTGKALRD